MSAIHIGVSPRVSTPAPAPAVRSTTRTPARSTGRASTRRKVARPPQPQMPADFFSPEAHTLLTRLLIDRAERWQTDGAPPLYFYARDSEPLWGEVARHRCSGTTLRIAGRRTLCESLCVDLERGLRLLTLAWTEQNTTTEGHSLEEWRVSLSGVLWRVGQHYRELARRTGAEGAQEIVRLAMNTLWW